MRSPLLAAMLLAAAPAAAQTLEFRRAAPPCVADGTPRNCVRNLACIGEEGRWFEGRAIGWNAGVLEGRTSDGVRCEGTWEIEPSGLGRSEIACEDGTAAEVIVTYQDHATGTAIGEGVTSAGERVRSFSGEHVVDYLREGGRPILPCGDEGVALDEEGVPIS